MKKKISGVLAILHVVHDALKKRVSTGSVDMFETLWSSTVDVYDT
jgi:hypothetical protein